MEDSESRRLQSDSLSVEVTTRCNSSCPHCCVRARGTRGESLSPDLVKTVVLEGYEAGYRNLHITGGEPLMWSGLPEILDYAFAMGYEKAFLNTNGTLLTAEVGGNLAAYDSLAVSVSLQGPKRLHDLMRGTGSYERAVQGIHNALNAGLPVHIFTTVGKTILPDLPRFAEELFTTFPHIRQLNFIQLIRVPGDVFDLSAEVLSPDDFLRLVKMVALLNLYGLKTDILNNPLAVVASRVLNMPWLFPSRPLYGPGSIMVAADLRITLAHSTTDHLGTYEPGSLQRILMSDEYHRAVSDDLVTCGDCINSHLCRTEGMTRPSDRYRDMRPHIPYCKRVLAEAKSCG
ncbi:MAG: radical SAM protein [Pseudomonadota bacterium]